MRRPLRTALFRFVRRIFETDDGRLILADALGGLLPRRPTVPLDTGDFTPPYPDLPERPSPGEPRHSAPIFITGRFRSGSTLLWNLFRHVEGCTAYYEPFNERQWFDPLKRGTRIDPSHQHASAYWREYDGLGILKRYYREEWVSRDLYMDAAAWNPPMREFVRILIDRAASRPVLQFNRADFRLPWLRAHFPEATLIHVYRHPRDQWCSSLMGDSFPLDGSVQDFASQDRFYLLPWARDLRYRFPFLDERAALHPYDLFYWLWKLSYHFGRTYAHHSIVFEDLVAGPREGIPHLMQLAGVSSFDLGRLLTLVARPEVGRWRSYAPAEWFLSREERCEQVLAEFFGG